VPAFLDRLDDDTAEAVMLGLITACQHTLAEAQARRGDPDLN